MLRRNFLLGIPLAAVMAAPMAQAVAAEIATPVEPLIPKFVDTDNAIILVYQDVYFNAILHHRPSADGAVNNYVLAIGHYVREQKKHAMALGRPLRIVFDHTDLRTNLRDQKGNKELPGGHAIRYLADQMFVVNNGTMLVRKDRVDVKRVGKVYRL